MYVNTVKQFFAKDELVEMIEEKESRFVVILTATEICVLWTAALQGGIFQVVVVVVTNLLVWFICRRFIRLPFLFA